MKKESRILFPRFSWALFAFLIGGYGELQAEPEVENARLVAQLEASGQAYEAARDYTAFFVKEELSEGRLDPPEEIFLKFEKPFKIYMKWLNPPKKGLEVHYERGKHDGKLAIHKPGFLTGLAGVIFLPQDSPWVRAGSEAYDIEDAGIGTFLTDFTKAVQAAERSGALAARESSPGTWDATFNVPGEDDTFFAKRCIVTFDEVSKLPVKMTLFDWQGRTTGIYDYQDLKLNIGSVDPAFKKHVHRSLFRVYTGDRG